MPGHIRNAIENTATVLVLLAAAAVTGYFGLAGAIGDRGPGESLFDRNALVLGFAISGAVLFGIFLPRFWYFSIVASWGPLLAVAVSGPIESLRRFFDAGNISVWVVLSAPVFALGSGYLAAYVGRRFWAAGDVSRPTSHTLPPLLAIGIAVLLVILPARLLANTAGFPPPFYRTRIDFLFFALQLLVIYGGVSVGVLTYWLRKKSTEQCLRPFNIIEAGVLGVAALSPLLAFRTSIYVVMGSPVKNASWSWDFAIAVWFFCVISAAASAGLLLCGPQIGARSNTATIS